MSVETDVSETTSPGLFDRALRSLSTVWRDMAAGREAEESVAAQMQACLSGKGGEISARTRAARLARSFLVLDVAGRLAFLRTLAHFDADPGAVAAAYAVLQAADGEAARQEAQMRLRRVLEPARMRLLTQFTTLPDGVKFLVDLRMFLLEHQAGDPALTALAGDLRTLLAQWFDVGFLELRRIDWESPAALLEKLVGYEAVHEIRSWRDLRKRLDSDRRCYAFFHPRMPAEPLIFVEVALVQGLADSVQRLLDQKAPVLDAAQADTAIFYSISNCQLGLAGISFGNFLIKRVVELLSAEFRNLSTFATLSPVPGFRRWLDALLADPGEAVVSDEEGVLLRAATRAVTGKTALEAVLAGRWARDPALVRVVEPVLLRLCARYLLHAARRGRAADPVAHFHLSNGARVERLDFLADVSDKGMRESAGLMVNYLYDPEQIEKYHEDYAGEGKRNASGTVRKLAAAKGRK